MNDAQLRAHVAGLYPGKKWRDRVNRMSDAQIYAVYKAKQASDEKKAQEAQRKKEQEKRNDTPF